MPGDVVAAARKYYTDLPYHNFQHIQNALDFAETLLDRCRKYSIPVDDDIVRLAIYFHDAGYHHDHKAKGFESKEAYSASIAEEELENLGYSEDAIQKVRQCILATKPDIELETPEQKIVRAADLAHIGTEYRKFRENSLQLREEHKQLHGEQLSHEDWVSSVKDTITFYLDQNIELTPEHDENRISHFHARARHNLERFLEEFG